MSIGTSEKQSPGKYVAVKNLNLICRNRNQLQFHKIPDNLPELMILNKLFQFSIQPLHRKPHYIKIRTFYPFHADVTDPFLNAISAGFIKWLIMCYIIIDFIGL
ncbi:hypothetical protein DSECCO2_548780 [anaerobic digester metagenome]